MIIRTPDRERYVIISKVPLEDDRLSWKARGLLAYLLSKPDTWTVIVAHLVKQAPDGKASVMAGLNELESLGYIRRSQKRSAGNKFDGIESEVFEEPLSPGETESRFSDSGKAVDGKADDRKSDASEERSLVNNEGSKNTSTSKSEYTIEFEELWAAYPRREAKIDAFKCVKARIKEGVSYAQLLSATQNYALRHSSTERQFQLLPSTFYGPGRRYEDYLEESEVNAQTSRSTLIDAAIAEIEKIFLQDVSCETSNLLPLNQTLFNRLSEREIRRMSIAQITDVLWALVHE